MLRPSTVIMYLTLHFLLDMEMFLLLGVLTAPYLLLLPIMAWNRPALPDKRPRKRRKIESTPGKQLIVLTSSTVILITFYSSSQTNDDNYRSKILSPIHRARAC